MAAALRIPSSVASKYMIIDEPEYQASCLPKKNREEFKQIYIKNHTTPATSNQCPAPADDLTSTADFIELNPDDPIIRKPGRPKGALGKKNLAVAAKLKAKLAIEIEAKIRAKIRAEENYKLFHPSKSSKSSNQTETSLPIPSKIEPDTICIDDDGQVIIE